MLTFNELKKVINKSIIYFRLLFVSVLIGLSTLALAQKNAFVLRGVVFKNNGAAARVANVLVVDLSNNVIVTTDDLGSFQIKCAIGDTLLFKQKDYLDQKLAIINENTLMVFLQPVINLSEVNIREATRKQELGQIMKDYGKQGVYNNGRTSVMSAIFSPVNGLYDLFGKGPKQAKRFQRFSTLELEQTEVDRRFTKTLVQKTIGLKDEMLQKFIDVYKPSYDDIKKWNDYELINYIKKSYQDFQEKGDQPGLQKLY